MWNFLERLSNFLMSLCAGIASFIFTLVAFLILQDLSQQIMASVTIGLFALTIVWLAYEKPNSGQARATKALIDRLLAVKSGDLSSPAPAAVREEMPDLAAAVDGLFEQVRSNIDNVQAMAMYDPVTALPNRLHFKREAERMLRARKSDEKLALLFIDLDGFKEVNDNLGHAQGDHVLTMVADRLRTVVKAEAVPGEMLQPLLARLAGDEFTLLFPWIEDEADAERIARCALTALSQPYEIASQRIDMGASIGVAVCPRHGNDLTSLMKAADIAMYHAKASGRSQCCLYEPRLAAAFEHKLLTEKAVRQGLQRGEFYLAVQPQVSARNGTVVVGEALLRWNHPDDGVRLPDSFLSIAEDSSLIVEIGDWVVEAVATTLSRWHSAGLTQRLAFNVSSRQIDRVDFFTRLRAAIGDAGSPAWLLELELSETMAMRCSEAVLAELTALRGLGVSIAIDKFGSGYSNLGRLKDMPIDRIKLDRSLIRDVDTSLGTRTIVSAVIHLIHGLGCEVVAAGVERKEQFAILRTLGCDTIQGRAFADAMPEGEFVRWVKSRAAHQRLPKIA
ncbi:MAG TPA: EAL domain-containing protein [Allosphingosinicella sp.]|jgi:diguanylate cyclase (GGDEF)-like protein